MHELAELYKTEVKDLEQVDLGGYSECTGCEVQHAAGRQPGAKRLRPDGGQIPRRALQGMKIKSVLHSCVAPWCLAY